MKTGVDGVDLMKLYAKGSHNGWNEFLTECLNKQQVNRLGRMRRALQIGMDDLVKKKISTTDIEIWFLRLQKSIEKTVRAIIRTRHPNPFDNAKTAKESDPRWKAIKNAREADLEAWYRQSGY